MKPKKKPKKRPKHYESKLKIHASFGGAIRALVIDKPKPKK